MKKIDLLLEGIGKSFELSEIDELEISDIVSEIKICNNVNDIVTASEYGDNLYFFYGPTKDKSVLKVNDTLVDIAKVSRTFFDIPLDLSCQYRNTSWLQTNSSSSIVGKCTFFIEEDEEFCIDFLSFDILKIISDDLLDFEIINSVYYKDEEIEFEYEQEILSNSTSIFSYKKKKKKSNDKKIKFLHDLLLKKEA